MRKRGSIVMKLIAQSLSKAGFDHILTLDLHQKEIQGYFDCPVENLRYVCFFSAQYLSQNDFLFTVKRFLLQLL
jgi:phosphoribosylpyrophosphate synthetase